MDLIIVESPTKAKTLSRFLGKDYDVMATMGHIMDLPKSPISVDVEHNFKPDYKPVERNLGTIEELRKVAKKAKKIYIATDPDREGEAIAEHVFEEIGDGKTSRIEFHEITKEAVEHALTTPRKINKHLVEAQTARRVLDRLVGYKASPILWKKVRRGLSAGRVQTVALRLIVEKEREIEKFKKEEYWEIGSELEAKGSKKFVVGLTKINGKEAKVNNEKDAKVVVSDLKKGKYEVLEVKKREVHRRPYGPFTTSTMTQAAANIFGWSAKKTMMVAQKLYEGGKITYHRTDSMNLSKMAQDGAKKYIEENFGKEYLPASLRIYKKTSKNAQEAHEAIRPTHVENTSLKTKSSKFGGDMGKLYELIWKKFMASQMADSVGDSTTVDARNGKYILRATGQVTKFDGWRKVYGRREADEIELPEVLKGEVLKLIKVLSEQKFTLPPARFNEASLIKTLEKLGIGRPSTYAPIISTIIFRQYVEKDEGRFVPTNVGLAVSDFLVENFPDTFDYEFTAGMEDKLDCVAKGECKWVGMMKDFWGPFSKKLDEVEKKSKRVKIETEKLGKKCPKCGAELVIRVGRFGKFVSCERFPDCDFTDKYEDRIGMKCPKCKKGEVIVKKTKKGRKFFGCNRYPECDFASWKDPRIEKKEKK